MGSNNRVPSRWFTEHHGLLRRLHLDRIKVLDEAVADLDGRIVAGTARWQREVDLLTSAPGFGDVVAQAWLGEIGPGSAGTRTRREEGDHRDRAHLTQDRLTGPQDRNPVPGPGRGPYTRRESLEQKQAWLERQMQGLHPGCTITITISPPEAA